MITRATIRGSVLLALHDGSLLLLLTQKDSRSSTQECRLEVLSVAISVDEALDRLDCLAS